MVTRAEQLLSQGLRWNGPPQTAPQSTRRLEFVANEWVMFIPASYTGTDANVFAWVPKVDTPDEHKPPAPAS